MKFFKINVYLIPVFLLLIFPEYSLQTSLHIEKKSCHTIYLCKSFLGLGVADWIIVFMSLILIAHILFNKLKLFINKDSAYLKIVLVYIFYLILGIFYNVIVQYHLISFLYDFKVILYFVTIYYWFKLFIKIEWSSKHIIYFFVIYAIGILWDYIYVSLFGVNHRGNNLPIIPTILPIFDPSFLMIAFVCFKKFRLLIIFLFLFEILSSINKANLGVIYSIFATLGYIIIYQHRLSYKLLFSAIFFSFLFFSVVFPLAVQEILPMLSADFKPDGLHIRKMKTLSLLDNFFSNFPVILGKGLGGTYFETYSSHYANVYSHGVNHLEGNVKFMMHTPLSLFYKLGLVGCFIMIFILTKVSIKLFKLSKLNNDNFLKFLSLIYPSFMMGSLISPGLLKYSVMAGIVLFISDQKIQSLKKID